MLKKLTLAILMCLATDVYAQQATIDEYPFLAKTDATRFAMLTKEIRCVVCQNQNIADSHAPLANDLRGKVYQMVLDKKSDAAIKRYLVQRYGEFILLQPRLNKVTAALWLFPFAAMLVIFLILFRFIKRLNLAD